MTTKLITAQELEKMADDGYRYDIIRGELIKISPAGGRHGKIAFRVGALLEPFVRDNELGELFAAETGFLLALHPDVLLAPDVSFVRAERMPAEEDQDGYFHLAPDLVVEVVSPWDRAREVNDKVMEYLDHGVRLVWLIEPRRKLVTVYGPDRTARILGEADELDGGAVLPGFATPVAAIFR